MRSIVAALLAACVLCAEYLALSFSFDARPLMHQSGAARWLGTLGKVAPAVLVSAAVLVTVFGARLRGAWTQVTSVGDSETRWLWASLHVIAFGLFYAASDQLFGGDPLRPRPATWIVAWVVTGFGVVFTLATSVLRPALLWRFVRDVAPVLASGLAIGVLAWAAGIASMELWDPLGVLTLYAVAIPLQWLVPDLVFDPQDAIVGSARFYIQVDPVCSGYEGIGLILAFLFVYFWSARATLRFPHAWLLVPIAVFAVFFGNVVRIAALIGVGLHVSPAVALGGFHSKAGWLFFCAIGLSLVGWSRRSPFFSHVTDTRRRSDNPVAPYVMPLLAVIAAALLTGLFATQIDRGYGLRVAAGAIVLLAYRRQLSVWDWRATLEATGIGALVFVLWLAMSPPPPEADVAEWRAAFDALSAPERTSWIFLKLVGSIGIIPIVEERAFRGYLLRRLIRSDFDAVPSTQLTWLAVLGSSLAFGALHLEWIAGTAAGVLFAWLQSRRGNLGEAVFAHAVSNTLIAVWALGLGRLDLWM